MNKTHTLKELADIGSKAACLDTAGAVKLHQNCREAFTKAVLDAVGYKFPVDPEREAFDAWVAEHGDGFMPCGSTDKAFVVWKAGRDNLRKYRQERAREALNDIIPQTAKPTPEANPPWIEWRGGKCPIPDTVERWEYKLSNDDVRREANYNPSSYAPNWEHKGTFNHIVAYRIIY